MMLEIGGLPDMCSSLLIDDVNVSFLFNNSKQVETTRTNRKLLHTITTCPAWLHSFSHLAHVLFVFLQFTCFVLLLKTWARKQPVPPR